MSERMKAMKAMEAMNEAKILIEVCAGGIEDCLIAQRAGADRIELNSALYLGGLSPSLVVLEQALYLGVTIPIICMVRPRGAGFCYSELEVALMFEEAERFLQAGAKGIAFGFLTAERQIDWTLTERMIKLCQQYQADSVFHRAFDCAIDPQQNIERLIELGCTRILTSGLAPDALAGADLLRDLQQHYGQKIQLCAGAGINQITLQPLIAKTGIRQIHGSFKRWCHDVTTQGTQVSYAYSAHGDYEQTDLALVQQLVEQVKNKGAK